MRINDQKLVENTCRLEPWRVHGPQVPLATPMHAKSFCIKKDVITKHVKLMSLTLAEHTSVDESSWSAFAELLRLVGQRHFYDAGDMSRWRVYLDGV